MYEVWYLNDFGYVIVFEENGKKLFLEWPEDDEPCEFFCDTEYGAGYPFEEKFDTKEEAFEFINEKLDEDIERWRF